MKLLKLSIFILLFSCSVSYSGDYHQRGQSHPVVYVITDSSGNPVSNQTPRLQVVRAKDGLILDHSDNTFKSSSWTTRYATMNYDANGEYYRRTISIDSSLLVSGDYICIVSNDDSTYGDQQAEVISYDTLGDLIRINR